MRCLSLVKACEGLRVGWQLQSPTLFLLSAELETLSATITGTHMHIGCLIRQKVDEKGITVVRFAEQLACTRANVYKIFSKRSIDTETLLRISMILEFDFFSICSKYYLDSVSE